MEKSSLHNAPADEGTPKSNSDRIALAAVMIVVGLGILIVIQSEEGSLVFSKDSDAWYCSPTSTTPDVSSNQTGARALYDDQVFFDFDQNFSSLAFNVTAVKQNDSYGFGPAYLLDALSNKDYWYQVGVSWDWAVDDGSTYFPGFSFNFEAWNSAGRPLPSRYSTDYYSFPIDINAGDQIQLKINFTGNSIGTFADDLNTDSYEYRTYPALNATQFIPNNFVNHTSFPTGVLMEWYHVNPYQCTRQSVTFSSKVTSVAKVQYCVDEWNFSSVSPRFYFTSKSSTTFGRCSALVTQDNSALKDYSYAVANVSSNDHEFIAS